MSDPAATLIRMRAQTFSDSKLCVGVSNPDPPNNWATKLEDVRNEHGCVEKLNLAARELRDHSSSAFRPGCGVWTQTRAGRSWCAHRYCRAPRSTRASTELASAAGIRRSMVIARSLFGRHGGSLQKFARTSGAGCAHKATSPH